MEEHIVADFQASAILILKPGGGTVAIHETFELAHPPSAVTAVDLDGDGDIDVVSGSTEEHALQVLLNEGGVLVRAEPILLPSPTSRIASIANGSAGATLAITDREGDAIVIVDWTQGEPSILRIDLAEGPSDIALGDLDSDGSTDIVVGHSQIEKISIIFREEDSFSMPLQLDVPRGVGRVALVALGEGSRPGIVATSRQHGGSVHVFENLGSRQFSLFKAFDTAGDPLALVACDLDNDAITDLALAGWDASVTIIHDPGGRAEVQIAGVHLAPFAMSCSDLDADGDSDLVLYGTQGESSILINDSPRGWLARMEYRVPGHAAALAHGDFNEDGTPDVAVVTESRGTLEIFLTDEHGVLRMHASHPAAPGAYAVAAGDFDGDGHVDLVSAPSTNGRLAIFKGDGRGGFALVRTEETGGTFRAKAEDLDGDGLTDVVLAQSGTNQLLIYRGDPDGVLRRDASLASPAASDVAVLDFNCDGRVDLATTNFSAASVTLFEQVEGGEFELADVFRVGNGPITIDAASLPSRPIGFLVSNWAEDTMSHIWLDGADGWRQEKLDVPGGVRQARYADMNGDGLQDLVTISQSQPSVQLASQDGLGAAEYLPTNHTTVAFDLVDLNNDGLPELVTISHRDGILTVYRSTCEE